MQTNTVIIIQKTSKGDVSGNTACIPLGSTCITSTGGKITVRSPLRNQSPKLRLGLLNVTDLINRIVQVLKRDLYWIRISAQDAGLMEPVEP